jgi:hypothetical protein
LVGDVDFVAIAAGATIAKIRSKNDQRVELLCLIRICAFSCVSFRSGWRVMPRGAEFRRRAQECYRLSTQLQQPEHRSFALELAKAWISLAEDHERKKATPNPDELMSKAEDGDRDGCSAGGGPTG